MDLLYCNCEFLSPLLVDQTNNNFRPQGRRFEVGKQSVHCKPLPGDIVTFSYNHSNNNHHMGALDSTYFKQNDGILLTSNPSFF